jgi:uncharacterized protein (TIGR02118 family)
MVKVSVLYPNDEGKTFNMDYYVDTHVPMVKKLLGSYLKNAAVEHGIAGGAPGEKATYIAMGHLYFDQVEDFVASFNPNAGQILGDLPNFTDIAPTVQISEVRI